VFIRKSPREAWAGSSSPREASVFGEGILIVKGFVLDVVFFLRLGFLDAMGSSSDIELVLDPRILIMRSMFFLRVVVRIGDGIFCGSVNISYGSGSW
jgi:hypothetical protein